MNVSPPPLLVSYTDLSDVWQDTGLHTSTSSLNLQQVPISKSGNVRLLKNVQTRLVKSSTVERLCVEYGGSPSGWFRCPVAELVCWRCDDWDGWKRNFRLQLRAVAQRQPATTLPVPIFVFVTKGPLDKSGKAVLDAVQKELAPRAVVHLSQRGTVGMQDLLTAVKAALAQSLEGRVGAYRAEVQKLLTPTTDSSSPEGEKDQVDLGALYVVKDSLAALLESAGMYQEACNEYSELEAMIEECATRMGGVKSRSEEEDGSEGARSRYTAECSVSQVAGVDECRQMWHSWSGTRRAVVATARDGAGNASLSEAQYSRTYIDFVLIPAIVCNMVRLLMKDSTKKVEALRVCRTFISNHRAVIARYEHQKKCPAGMEAAWTFSACVSSVLRVCMDVDDPEQLEDVGLLEKLCDLLSDDASDISKLNVKFHRAVGQLLLEARDVLKDEEKVAEKEGRVAPVPPTAADILEDMTRATVSTFSLKPASSLTPQNSLSTPRANAMASIAESMFFAHHQASNSLENVDLDASGDLRDSGDVSGDAPGDSLESQRSHNRSISLHNPAALETALTGSSSGGFTSPTSVTNHTEDPPGSKSVLDAEAAIDGHAAPLFLLLGGENDEISTRWIPTYAPLVSHAGAEYSSKSESASRMASIIASAAKSFFERGGYFRNAGVLSVQLGDDAFEMKKYSTATGIFMEVADMTEEENWTGVYEDVLLRLARSQVRDGDRGIVGTCHRLLCLRQDSTHASMLLRATELSGGSFHDAFDHDDDVLSLNPCGLSLESSSSLCGKHVFLGDTVRVPVVIVNHTGVPIPLNNLKALFEIEQQAADEGGFGELSPHPLNHQQFHHLIQQSPRSMESPSSASAAFKRNEAAAARGDRRSRVVEAKIVGTEGMHGSGGRTHLVVEGGPRVGAVPNGHGSSSPRQSPLSVKQQATTPTTLCMNPIVPGTYTLSKIEASINGVRFEIASQDPDSPIQITVRPPEPRVRVDAFTRRLVAGEEQWLGIEVDVLRDDDVETPSVMNVEWPGAVGTTPSSSLSAIRPVAAVTQTIINGTPVDPDEGYNIPNTLQYANLATLGMPWTAWWRVHVSRLADVPAEDVRVSVAKAASGGIGRSNVQQPDDSDQESLKRTIAAGKSVLLPISLLFEGTGGHPSSLRPSATNSRVVSAAASVVIDQPFLVQTQAREITKGVILVSMYITSSADRTVIIDGVHLRCQQGFSILGQPRKHSNQILPPLATMCASFVLKLEQGLLENRAVAQATVYRTGKLAPSVASISYSVVREEETLLPPPEHDTSRQRPSYSHEHQIALQLSSIATDTSTKNDFVSLRMLGPFNAIIGCPVMLCWQLERVGGSADDNDVDDDSRSASGVSGISYEVRADASSWSRGSRAQGVVSLGHRNGSVATIEMAWTPTTIGALALPSLKLHDVFYQDLTRGKNVVVKL